jgi:hypothetical protein
MNATAPVPGTLFVPDGPRVVPTALTSGPWDPDHAHGGATAALLAHLIEQVPTAGAMVPVRLTMELLRPVRRRPLRTSASLVRDGKRVQLVRAELAEDDGTTVATCVGLRLRRTALDLDDVDRGPPSGPGPEQLGRFAGGPLWRRGFFEAVDLRVPVGTLGEPGAAAGWVQLLAPVLPDVAISPLVRVAAAADFGNGISAPLPMDRSLFINPDLTVAIDRTPNGPWVGLDARSTARATGVGQTLTVLHDRTGTFGTAIQSLLVDRRP